MSLDVGSVAPDFTLKSQHGEDVSLSSFRGTNVLLVFIPFAFSGICSDELAALRDDADTFEAAQTQILVVSCDHFFSNRAFADQQGHPFPVLSDFWPHGEVSRAYGIFNDEVGVPNRGTYVIDREGVLRWMVQMGIGDQRDLADYRAAVAELS
ncbi:peroxiredoxin [Aeromicrobium sp. NPDC092404]|uniref:peroxiredoxin n=1 Tax=Aeromicrobium sp. NPDC092404 TaxID=3154976 RepID=UPI0034476CD9